MKSIKNLKFQENKYPEVLQVINKLAKLEQRKPQDTAKRLILQYGKERISKLENSDSQQPASVSPVDIL